jgi:hypothetical protein
MLIDKAHIFSAAVESQPPRATKRRIAPSSSDQRFVSLESFSTVHSKRIAIGLLFQFAAVIFSLSGGGRSARPPLPITPEWIDARVPAGFLLP